MGQIDWLWNRRFSAEISSRAGIKSLTVAILSQLVDGKIGTQGQNVFLVHLFVGGSIEDGFPTIQADYPKPD